MPGLFAALDLAARPDFMLRFERLHQAGMPRPFAQADRWADAGAAVGLARVDLGVLNPEPQPAHDPAGRYVLVFQGDLYDRQAKLAALAAQGVKLLGASNADLLLGTWIAHGRPGVAALNGSYAFALWDRQEETLVVGSDRYGSRPHFYSTLEGRFFFAADLKAILAARGDRPAVNERGLAEFMALEYPLEDRTLLHDIHVFPAGTWLTVDKDGLHWQRYWEPRYRAGEGRSDAEVVAGALPLYRRAVDRCMKGPVSIALSGGTDSRLILALTDRRDFPTYTFGSEGSEDVVYARMVAQTLGLTHHVMPISEDFMARNIEAIMTWGEGMVSLFHGHNGDQLEAKRAIAPIVLRGMTAEFCRLDAVEGILAEPARSRAHQAQLLAFHLLTGRKAMSRFDSDDALVDRVVKCAWTALPPTVAREVLAPEFAQAMAEAVRLGVAEAIAPIQAPSLEDRLATFNVGQRQRRFSPWGLRTAASMLETRKPLDDYELIDYLLEVPFMQRRKLQDRIIQAASPALASLPRTGTGVAIDAGVARRGAAYAQKLLAARLDKGRVQSFANPQENLRTHARAFFEGLLLDPATLHNGYFNAEGVRRLVEAHMSGRANAASALCMLATVELFRRRYVADAGWPHLAA